jgi:hypothetical protein
MAQSADHDVIDSMSALKWRGQGIKGPVLCTGSDKQTRAQINAQQTIRISRPAMYQRRLQKLHTTAAWRSARASAPLSLETRLFFWLIAGGLNRILYSRSKWIRLH